MMKLLMHCRYCGVDYELEWEGGRCWKCGRRPKSLILPRIRACIEAPFRAMNAALKEARAAQRRKKRRHHGHARH